MLDGTLGLLLFPALMAFAASSDLLTMTISNRVSVILIASFFALAFASGMNLHSILWHAGAALAVLVVAFVFFARGWIGGGDAKQWVAIAQKAGFKYFVAQAKHHEGFHWWDTAYSDFKVTKTPFGRDLVAIGK